MGSNIMVSKDGRCHLVSFKLALQMCLIKTELVHLLSLYELLSIYMLPARMMDYNIKLVYYFHVTL